MSAIAVRRKTNWTASSRYNDNNPLQTIPVARIVKFAIATAMRQEEICRLRWP